MKTLLNKWFIAGCLIWVVVFTSRKLGHPLPSYINNYADDAFAIPVIASLTLCFQRVVIFKSNYYTFAMWHVVFITAYVILVFEVLLPIFSRTYTGDWIDAVLYVVGGIFFYTVMNIPVIEVNSR